MMIPAEFADADDDGYTTIDGDCEDNNPSVFPMMQMVMVFPPIVMTVMMAHYDWSGED